MKNKKWETSIKQTLQEALETDLEEFSGYFKYEKSGEVVQKAVNVVIGIDKDGYKELLGFWISETESATY